MDKSEKSFQASLRNIENDDKPAKRHPNYGVMSLALATSAICCFLYGASLTVQSISCVFAEAFTSGGGGNSQVDFKTGMFLIMCSFVLLIITLSVAGAGVATDRGSFLSLLVIVGSMVPFVYAVCVLLFDAPADFFDVGTVPASPSISSVPGESTVTMTPQNRC